MVYFVAVPCSFGAGPFHMLYRLALLYPPGAFDAKEQGQLPHDSLKFRVWTVSSRESFHQESQGESSAVEVDGLEDWALMLYVLVSLLEQYQPPAPRSG